MPGYSRSRSCSRSRGGLRRPRDSRSRSPPLRRRPDSNERRGRGGGGGGRRKRSSSSGSPPPRPPPRAQPPAVREPSPNRGRASILSGFDKHQAHVEDSEVKAKLAHITSMSPMAAVAPPALYNPIVEAFLKQNTIEPHAAARLRVLPKEMQEVVMQGTLAGARDPTAVVIGRIRKVAGWIPASDFPYRGMAMSGPGSVGNPQLAGQLSVMAQRQQDASQKSLQAAAEVENRLRQDSAMAAASGYSGVMPGVGGFSGVVGQPGVMPPGYSGVVGNVGGTAMMQPFTGILGQDQPPPSHDDPPAAPPRYQPPPPMTREERQREREREREERHREREERKSEQQREREAAEAERNFAESERIRAEAERRAESEEINETLQRLLRPSRETMMRKDGGPVTDGSIEDTRNQLQMSLAGLAEKLLPTLQGGDSYDGHTLAEGADGAPSNGAGGKIKEGKATMSNPFNRPFASKPKINTVARDPSPPPIHPALMLQQLAAAQEHLDQYEQDEPPSQSQPKVVPRIFHGVGTLPGRAPPPAEAAMAAEAGEAWSNVWVSANPEVPSAFPGAGKSGFFRGRVDGGAVNMPGSSGSQYGIEDGRKPGLPEAFQGGAVQRGNRKVLWDEGGVAGHGEHAGDAGASDTLALTLEEVGLPAEYPPRQPEPQLTEEQLVQLQTEAQEREYQQRWVQEQMRAHMALFETQRQIGFGMTETDPKTGGPAPKRRHKSNQPMMPGDWECPRCGDHQFSRNWSCRNCGGMRDAAPSLAKD